MDFREYVEKLEKFGMLRPLDEQLDLDTEVGPVIRLANDKGLPAVWARKLAGCMVGSSLVGNLFSAFPRIAVAFGLSPDTDYYELVSWFGSAIQKRRDPIFVENAPCQEHVLLAEEIDISLFPAPKTHPQDGGRYIGTLANTVCADPDSKWVNWGNYRTMVHTKNSLGMFLSPANHGGIILRKYHERGEPMEVAQFYGGDPLCTIVSASGVPYGTSEMEVVGGMRGQPLELVKCKSVQLHVPADAELVIEGTISPGDVQDEGPFGEYPGYVVADVAKRPVFRISAITYRNNPIMPTCCLGYPTDMLLTNVSAPATIKKAMEAAGLPVVKVGIPIESNRQAVVVSVKTPVAGMAHRVANIVWTDRNGAFCPYVFVVNDDVDPMDLGAVFHALVSKCHPAEKIHVQKDAWNIPLTPYVRKSPWKEIGVGGANVCFDCTWPVDWSPHEIPHRCDFENTYSDSLKSRARQIVAKW